MLSYFHCHINYYNFINIRVSKWKTKDQVTTLMVKIFKMYNLIHQKYYRDILLNNLCDPDLNFYNINTKNVNTSYIVPENFNTFLDDSPSECFSFLHLNIRSMNKNFEKFKKILAGL